MSLSENLFRYEFACKCGKCGQDTIDAELIKLLQMVRDHYAAPVVITSGNRCAEHNAKVGGSPKSQHLISRAADFRVKGVEPKEVAKYLETQVPHHCGIGVYDSWVHLDTRSTRARWND